MYRILLVAIVVFNVSSVQAQTTIRNTGQCISVSKGVHIGISGNLEQNDNGVLKTNGKVTVNGNIINQGNIIIEEEGSLLNKGDVNTGNSPSSYQVKHIVPEGISLMSIPIEKQNSSVFKNSIINHYVPNTNVWLVYNEEYLNAFEGYLIENSSNELLQNFSANVLNTGLFRTTLATEKWQLLGNPYPCAINWNEIENGKSKVEDVFYTWNGHNYTTYLANNVNIGVNEASQFIARGQAFFVKALAANSENDSFYIGDKSKAHFPDSLIERDTAGVGFLKLKVVNNDYSDETVVYFNEFGTSGFDVNFEAEKLFSIYDNIPHLFTKTADNDRILAINAIPDDSKYKELPLYFIAGGLGNYTLSAKINSTGKFVYLIDNLSGNLIDAQKNMSYTFSNSATVDIDFNRFSIVFSSKDLTISDSIPIENDTIIVVDSDTIATSFDKRLRKENEIKVYPNPTKGIFNIFSPTGIELSVINDIGSVVLRKVLIKDENIIDINNLPSGVYLLLFRNEEAIEVKRIVKI